VIRSTFQNGGRDFNLVGRDSVEPFLTHEPKGNTAARVSKRLIDWDNYTSPKQTRSVASPAV
jgi:hypothetical protein